MEKYGIDVVHYIFNITPPMKKLLHYLIALSFCIQAKGQIMGPIEDGYPQTSITINFNDSVAIAHFLTGDTVGLWQIGHSRKTFFGIDTTGPLVMITDSINNYPTKANNSFIIKLAPGYNTIVDFWHRYQTDGGHDGGLVEFSIDTGATWQNIKGACNIDSFPYGQVGVITDNFYTFNDTLLTGEPAFTGIRNYTQYSRFQFFMGLPAKSTTPHSCNIPSHIPILVRFRFISDTTPDTLAGWMIDSIKVENDLYVGGVNAVFLKTHPVFPNPSCNGHFVFPSINDEGAYIIEVYNTMGERIFKTPYKEQLDISPYPRGLYYYKVSGPDQFTGQLLYD